MKIYFVHATQTESLFPSYFNLFLNLSPDLLDFIEVASRFQIIVCRKSIGSVACLIDLARGRKSSFSLKTEHIKLGLMVAVL